MTCTGAVHSSHLESIGSEFICSKYISEKRKKSFRILKVVDWITLKKPLYDDISFAQSAPLASKYAGILHFPSLSLSSLSLFGVEKHFSSKRDINGWASSKYCLILRGQSVDRQSDLHWLVYINTLHMYICTMYMHRLKGKDHGRRNFKDRNP